MDSGFEDKKHTDKLGFEETTHLEGTQKKSFKQKLLVVVGVLLLLGALLLLFNYTNRELQTAATVVATVNGEEISKEELYEAMLAHNGRDVLDRLIVNQLIIQEAEKREITVSEAEISAEIQEVIDHSFYGMEEHFHQALLEYGVTEEKLREDLKNELFLRKIAEGELDITEEDEREYFAANQQSFHIREEVAARHILLDSREEADEVFQLLEAGGDFAELAEEYSIDHASAVQGGNLGFFERGRMVPEFEEAAFSLEKGQYSHVVESQYGYHVIEVLDRRDAREVTFEEVRDEVREKMNSELISTKIGEQLDLLWESAKVEYLL